MFCLWLFPPPALKSVSCEGLTECSFTPSLTSQPQTVLTTAGHSCQFADKKPDKSLEQTQRQAGPGSTEPLQAQRGHTALYLLSWVASPDPWWGEFGRQLPFLGCALRNSSEHSGHRDLLLHPPALPTTGEKIALREGNKECSNSSLGDTLQQWREKSNPQTSA